jgi:hypothetical protein
MNVGFGGPTTGINCALANVGKKSLDVLVEVLDGTGGTPASSTESLVPGNSGGEAHFAQGFFYCRFTFKGSNKQLRATAQAIDGNFSVYGVELAR